MADRARKVAKKRQKRDQKRQGLRRQAAVSPVKRAAGGRVVACVVNGDWRTRGQAVPFVARQGPGGTLVMASFMIDLWCAGLKDVWGAAGVTLGEVEDNVDTMDERLDGTYRAATVEEVGGIVAGAVRFARQNGFKLPKVWDKWSALLGDLDVEGADLSAFGVDGKLVWAAPLTDLRRRLIGSTVEQFLARPDVEVVTDDEWDAGDVPFVGEGEAGDDGDVSDEELMAGAEPVGLVLANVVADWCKREGREPSAGLPVMAVAYLVILVREGLTAEDDDGADDYSPPSPQEVAAALGALRGRIEAQGRPHLASNLSAVEQLAAFIAAADGTEAEAMKLFFASGPQLSEPDKRPPAERLTIPKREGAGGGRRVLGGGA
jgi:hypothetical protein